MPVFSVKLPYKIRCNLPECGKPSHLVFRQTMNGVTSTFCSPYHARVGEERWNDKIDKNIRPDLPHKPQEDIMIDGNTELIGGEE